MVQSNAIRLCSPVLAVQDSALARHSYHCLKFKDPYDPEKAFRGSSSTPASEQELADLRADLDEKFEVVEAHLRQVEG